MMIVVMTLNSSLKLVPVMECLRSSNTYRFEFSVLRSHCLLFFFARKIMFERKSSQSKISSCRRAYIYSCLLWWWWLLLLLSNPWLRVCVVQIRGNLSSWVSDGIKLTTRRAASGGAVAPELPHATRSTPESIQILFPMFNMGFFPSTREKKTPDRNPGIFWQTFTAVSGSQWQRCLSHCRVFRAGGFFSPVPDIFSPCRFFLGLTVPRSDQLWHACTWGLKYTWTDLCILGFSPSGFFRFSKCLDPTPGLTSEYSHGWPLRKQRFQSSTSFLSQYIYACIEV